MPAKDFKKAESELYLPKRPIIIDIPLMRFLMVRGKGNPNTSPVYKNAVEVLYGLSYAIKMSKNRPQNFYEYVVPPLEGLWWLEGKPFDGEVIGRKDDFGWIMMIRQPEFVTNEIFEIAKINLARKKPGLDLSTVSLEDFKEGLCAQIMHIGSYDEEGATVAALEDFIKAQGYRTEMSGLRQHHEIYLGDPRKVEPDKLKTVIRHPIVAL
jgi:hypothetical protein